MASEYLKVFQYGSNMNAARFNSSERLDGKARIVGVARLDAYGIRFDLYSKKNRCCVTDIVKATDEYVLGVLYDVPIHLVIAPLGKRSRMDEIEGALPDGTGNYRQVLLSVTTDERNLDAVTYIGTEAGKKRFAQMTIKEQQVSEEYFRHLMLGAQTLEFPQEYRTYLEYQAGKRTRVE